MVLRTIRLRFLLSALVLFCLILSACRGTMVHRLTDQKYSPRPANAPVDIYVGKADTPHEPIAVIDSDRYPYKDDEARQLMLADLEKRARRIGADALQDLRLLPIRVRGFVLDEKVPIPYAVMQGDYELYFLRAEAIKYLEPVDLPPTELPADESALDNIP